MITNQSDVTQTRLLATGTHHFRQQVLVRLLQHHRSRFCPVAVWRSEMGYLAATLGGELRWQDSLWLFYFYEHPLLCCQCDAQGYNTSMT
ncbi:hypothetical protein CVT25_003488 [Psilocybe cyanescens]|uniref:Uncharacterized protein n=1 Tax=Psilocybe cyanescens TaxID=93625 RepID=A0A409WMA2_PSICY|nr:hypothetical protein CVT25_003488 [Psilocybe cyanescens]